MAGLDAGRPSAALWPRSEHSSDGGGQYGRGRVERRVRAFLAARTTHNATLDYSETVADSLKPAWLSQGAGETLEFSLHVVFGADATRGHVQLTSVSHDDTGGQLGRPELSLGW